MFMDAKAARAVYGPHAIKVPHREYVVLDQKTGKVTAVETASHSL